MAEKVLNIPLSQKDILGLSLRELVYLNGVIFTGAKFFCERALKQDILPPIDFKKTNVLLHVHPMMKEVGGRLVLLGLGPTSSIMYDTYMPTLIMKLGLRAILGKTTVGKETMKVMKETNCMMIDVGYESGSDSILKNVKKGIMVEQMRPFAKEAKRAGLSIHGNWIIGLPGETKETIQATKKLIKETRADAITVAVVTPFPGTELYRWAKENGYLITEDPNEYLDERGHQKSIISYPQLSSQEIREAVDGILKSYYLSPSYVPIALRRVFNRNGLNEMKVLWRSAKAFLKYILNR